MRRLLHVSIASQRITLDFRSGNEPATQADLTYHITPTTISITDTGKGSRSVTNDIEAVLRKIEYWHPGSITGFRIMYRDENGVWDGIKWDGPLPTFFALGETDEGKAKEMLTGLHLR